MRNFKKKYVSECNRLLLENDAARLTLDFRNNSGGKPEVMMAGLLPLLNMSRRKILTYFTNSTGMHKDIVKYDGVITCISNNSASMRGSRCKLMQVKKINVLINTNTASAAEQCVIALRVFSNVKVIGHSHGYTTCNKYFVLSNGDGIEVPVGYMTDVNGRVYRNAAIHQ
jgi:C-terminal processing protease CtpA/Prc